MPELASIELTAREPDEPVSREKLRKYSGVPGVMGRDAPLRPFTGPLFCKEDDYTITSMLLFAVYNTG